MNNTCIFIDGSASFTSHFVISSGRLLSIQNVRRARSQHAFTTPAEVFQGIVGERDEARLEHRRVAVENKLLKERIRLLLLSKYGPKAEQLSDAQLPCWSWSRA